MSTIKACASGSVFSELKESAILEFSHTYADYPKNKTITSIFEEIVNKRKSQIAIICNESKITYQELNEQSNRLARYLIENKLQKEEKVGIVINRSIEMMIAVISIVKAGGAFVPIDPMNPRDRIKKIIGDSDIKIILSQRKIANKLQFSGTTICLEDQAFHNYDPSNIEKKPSPTDLAYVIYTSGSSGEPKGVMVENASVVNYFYAITEKVKFEFFKTVIPVNNIIFDFFISDHLVPLLLGLKVVVANESQQKNPIYLSNVIVENKVDILITTPSRIQLLLNSNRGSLSLKGLKTIVLGGEGFSKGFISEIRKITSCKIYNTYGPTEATDGCTIKEIVTSSDINIGKPTGNTHIYIMNVNNEIMPIGVEGELCISGNQIARGYLNQPELTEEKFIQDPFLPDKRMYKTGDLGKWLPNGEIELLGRIDQQVKIRGHRIELAEIENTLKNHNLIDEAVVVVNGGGSNLNLFAYFVSESSLQDSELKRYLSSKLPEYMIPVSFTSIKRVPLNKSGKVDRKTLLSASNKKKLLELQKGLIKDDLTEIESIEFRTQETILKVLNSENTLKNITQKEDLLALGMNSLSFVSVVATLEKEFDIEFEDEDMNLSKFINLNRFIQYIKAKLNSLNKR